MPSKRKPVSKTTEKLIYQQAGSRCSFCGFGEIAALDIHHITYRSDNGPDDPANLILVCKNCHARVHSGAIPEAEVRRVKASQGAIIHRMPGVPTPASPPSNVVSIAGDATGSIIANHLTIRTNGKLKGPMSYPAGSIGADLLRKNYVAYLAGRYNEFRSAGLASYGQKGTHHHGAIHTQIKSRFKAAGTYFVPVERFDELVRFLHARIDQTIQGRRNGARGDRAYQSFDEFALSQKGR